MKVSTGSVEKNERHSPIQCNLQSDVAFVIRLAEMLYDSFELFPYSDQYSVGCMKIARKYLHYIDFPCGYWSSFLL